MGQESLKNIIIEEIRKKGKISFKRFMELALHHPEFGYYSSGKVRIGKDGDFYTSSHVHSLFGYTIAKKFIDWVSDKKECAFLELGGGEGYLAMDILTFISQRNPHIMKRIKYIIMEKSKTLVNIQREKIKKFIDYVKWVEGPSEITDTCIFIFANEFYDTFPVRRFLWRNSLYEIYLTEENGDIVETISKVNKNDDIWNLIRDKVNTLENEQEIEISEDSIYFTENLLRGKCGIFIIIDYGDTWENLIQRQRRSIRGFTKHRFVDNIYSSPGDYDITANVCFTFLEMAGKEMGWFKRAFTPQGKFLIEEGIYDLMNEYLSDKKDFEKVKTKLAVNTLINPGLMGEAFFVMIMEKECNTTRL